MPNNQEFTNITEPSDIAQTIKELNDDKMIDSFSNIDMKSNLTETEVSAIIAVDYLVSVGFLPRSTTNITRLKKRLSVSVRRGGREDIVKIAQGMSQNKTGEGIFSRIGGLFRPGGN